MPHTSDAQFLDDFHHCRFTLATWTHEAHVRMAFLLLQQNPFGGALERVRTGIQKLNAVIGVAKVGYHETITQACLQIIAHRQSQNPHATWQAFRAAHPDLLDFAFIGKYYSKERLFSPEAKSTFIEPDREKLPS